MTCSTCPWPCSGVGFRWTSSATGGRLSDGAGAPAFPDPGGSRIEEELFELEDIIDENNLRGAPLSALKEFAGDFRSSPETRRDLERIARECKAENLSDSLSPEVFFLLFARKKK